jgi:hypothetical protein
LVIGTSAVGFVHNYVMLHLRFSPINLISYQYIQCIFIIFYGTTFTAIDMKIGYSNKLILSVLCIKFLGLTLDCTLSWRIHADHLTTKLSTAYYAVRSIKPLMSHKTLLLIYYYVFIQSCYGITFWGNSCHSIQIFQLQ